LDELKEQREDLQTTIDELKESIEEKRTASHQALDELQIGLIQLQERLKREVIDYLNELAKEFRRHRTNNQISATIQRELSSERTDRTSQRTIGQVRSNQSQGLGGLRRSHSNSGHSRRSASPVSEETSHDHDRTPSSLNRVEPTPTNAVKQRSPPRETVLVKEEKKTPVSDSVTAPLTEENDLLRDMID
jgi:ABC-type transporter Mla subunit MlaD